MCVCDGGLGTCSLGQEDSLGDDHLVLRVPGPVHHALTTLHGEVDVSHHRHSWKPLYAGHCRTTVPVTTVTAVTTTTPVTTTSELKNRKPTTITTHNTKIKILILKPS